MIGSISLATIVIAVLWMIILYQLGVGVLVGWLAFVAVASVFVLARLLRIFKEKQSQPRRIVGGNALIAIYEDPEETFIKNLMMAVMAISVTSAIFIGLVCGFANLMLIMTVG